MACEEYGPHISRRTGPRATTFSGWPQKGSSTGGINTTSASPIYAFHARRASKARLFDKDRNERRCVSLTCRLRATLIEAGIEMLQARIGQTQDALDALHNDPNKP